MSVEQIFRIGPSGLADYTSFAAFQAAQQLVDWVTPDKNPVAELEGITSETVTVSGWTGLDVNHILEIRPVAGMEHGMSFSGNLAGFLGGISAFKNAQQYSYVHDIIIQKNAGTVTFHYAAVISNAGVTMDKILIDELSAVKGSGVSNESSTIPKLTNFMVRGFYSATGFKSNRTTQITGLVAINCDQCGRPYSNAGDRNIIYNGIFVDCTSGVPAGTEADFHNCASTISSQLTGTDSPYVSNVVDADFVNKLSGDFHLSSGSGLIGQGVNRFISGVLTDGDGQDWPASGAWDIGWDYQAGTNSVALSVVTPPTKHSSFQLNNDGSFQYAFDDVSYSRPNTDFFEYNIADANGTSNTARVDITIQPDGVAQSSINIGHTVDGVLFTWTVNGYDAALLTGVFYDGSPWAAPSVPGGAITLTQVTPDSYDPVEVQFASPQNHGIMKNPSSSGIGNTNQGYLPTATHPYNASLDLRNNLPATLVPASEGIISLIAPQFINEGRTSLLQGQCTQCFSVLTILDAPPSGSASGEYFRPGIYAANKTIYKSEDFDFTTMPALAAVTNALQYNGGDDTAALDWWSQVWAGESVSSASGEYGRAFVPGVGPSNGYSADVGINLVTQLLNLFDDRALSGTKKQAIYYLLQAGIDIYGAWKSGFTWGPGGAGQSLGKRQRISFFGALINNTAIKDEIAAIRANATRGTIPFQEDGQVQKQNNHGKITMSIVSVDDFSIGDEIQGATSGAVALITSITGSSPVYTFEYLLKGETVTSFANNAEVITNNTATGSATKDVNPPAILNVPVWGDGFSPAQENHIDKDLYWDQMVSGNAFDGFVPPEIDPGTNARNQGDPYFLIDGPAMKPGVSYMSCCSTTIMMGYVLIMRMWPEFNYVAGNQDLADYIDRVWDDTGIWTQPDVCAPPDPRDIASGKPYTYYGQTWGDDGNGNCITNSQADAAGHPNAPVSGRYPALHATPLAVLRESFLANELWPAYGKTP